YRRRRRARDHAGTRMTTRYSSCGDEYRVSFTPSRACEVCYEPQPGFCVSSGLRSRARCGIGISLYLSGIGPLFAFGNLLVFELACAMLCSTRALAHAQLRWLSK